MTELQDNPLRDLNNARNLPKYMADWEHIEQISEEERESIATFTVGSPTPETDNLARGNHVVPTEWAEQLERERDEARKDLEGARGKAKLIAAEMLVKLKDMEAERDYARNKATKAWESHLKLDTENRRLERKLEELRLAYNEAVAEPPLKFKRIT